MVGWHHWLNGHAAAAKLLQSCPTVWPHRRQPTRLPCPWDPPGKNTGVGCHFLLQCRKVKSESEVVQHEFEQIQGELACCISWGRKESNTT